MVGLSIPYWPQFSFLGQPDILVGAFKALCSLILGRGGGGCDVGRPAGGSAPQALSPRPRAKTEEASGRRDTWSGS